MDRQIVISGVNAAIITILIAIISAYSLFVYGIMQDLEMQVLREAEKINQIQFIRSSYLPNDNKYSIPNDPQHTDSPIETLLADIYLLIPVFPVVRDSKLKNGEGIPKDPSKRAEKALQLLNILCNSYPFPQTLNYYNKSWWRFKPKPVILTGIAEVRKWLSDLKEVTDSLEPIFTLYPSHLPENLNDNFNLLKAQKKSEIIASRNDPNRLKFIGHIDPFLIFDDLSRNILQADNIVNSVEYQLKKINKFKQELPSKTLIVLGLIFSFIVLLSGVIMPLIWNNVNRFFLLWLPAFFYMVAYGYIVIFVLQKIWKI